MATIASEKSSKKGTATWLSLFSREASKIEMGSQVNFLMTAADERDFCSWLLEDPEVEILRAVSPHQPVVPMHLPLPDGNQAFLKCFSIWNASIADRAAVTPRKKLPCEGFAEGAYLLEAEVYPVIEFRRSVETVEGMRPGRIWAQLDHHSLDEQKQREFKNWFRRLARWLNKWPNRWHAYRVGPGAKSCFDAGGLVLLGRSFVPEGIT